MAVGNILFIYYFLGKPYNVIIHIKIFFNISKTQKITYYFNFLQILII